jgi:peptidyl-prolyl cis-trans isomerase B (cyclophilin B)
MGLVLAVTLLGCKRQPADPEEAGAVTPANKENSDGKHSESDARLHQPFAEATHQEPPLDWQRPPDTTMAGKSVGKLYTEVVRIWDSIRFVADDRKRIAYRATLETDLGNIDITLQPDLAPNHVRNFLALAQVGYYDGLVFERIVHDELEPNSYLDLIVAGCPLGTGQIGYGSIGYWMKPEFNPQAVHEEGTLGALHGIEADTAACRFYITLCKAPMLDGNYTVFGKLTQGLDVARRIFEQPVRRDDEDPEWDGRPLKPIVIKRVTIHTKVDKTGSDSENKD